MYLNKHTHLQTHIYIYAYTFDLWFGTSNLKFILSRCKTNWNANSFWSIIQKLLGRMGCNFVFSYLNLLEIGFRLQLIFFSNIISRYIFFQNTMVRFPPFPGLYYAYIFTHVHTCTYNFAHKIKLIRTCLYMHYCNFGNISGYIINILSNIYNNNSIINLSYLIIIHIYNNSI